MPPEEARRQEEVLALLQGGALGPAVERIDTPGAIVLLAGAQAFKLKRAACFSFMDLSTLELRRATLVAELELNRRTAPMLYRRVLAVTREGDGRLALDGQGPAVEWLLEMQRFPAEMQLDRVAANGGLDRRLVEALAAAIARLHATAEQRPNMGGCSAMQAVIRGNASDLRSLVPPVLDRDRVEALVERTGLALDRARDLLERRRGIGFVRRCHGDLHLANIVLLEGKPVLFDCLEFSEELGSVDTLYDLAFLLMDLVERGYHDAAWRLDQAYSELTEDDAGKALLPLFLSVRAAIRAKVRGFSVAVREGLEARAERERARAYLALAERGLSPVTPRLVAVGGRSGTGKSSLAAALAPSLGPVPGASVLRSDVIRKRLFGRSATERLPPEAYREEVSDRVFAHMATRAGVLLAGARSVVVDGIYGRPGHRAAIQAVAAAAGVAFTGIWLQAAEEILVQRVARREGDASDATPAVVQAQRDLDPVPTGWLSVAAGRPLTEVVTEAEALIRPAPS